MASSQCQSSFSTFLTRYGCKKIWEGDEPFNWMETLKDAISQPFPMSVNLAHEVWACLLVLQLRITLKRVEQGSKVFCNPTKFCKEFDHVTEVYPFPLADVDDMKKKIEKWIIDTHLSVPKCETMIKEMKMFLEPAYNQLKTKSLEVAFKGYKETLDSCQEEPSANTLCKVFLRMFSGSLSEAKREWQQIIKEKHPDTIHLKPIAKNSSVFRTVNNSTAQTDSPFNTINLHKTLPGQSHSGMVDEPVLTKKSKFFKSKKGKDPVPRNRSIPIRGRRDGLFDSTTDESGESDGIVAPSQETDDDDDLGMLPRKFVEGPYRSRVKDSPAQLVESAAITSQKLAEATQNLMVIIKDPYDPKVKETPQQTPPRKKQKWNAPQNAAEQLSWSSCEEFEDDKKPEKTKKHGLKMRKTKRYWTSDEEGWIKEGLAVYGYGNWAEILANYPFVGRTSVNIKDKFRTMQKHGEV